MRTLSATYVGLLLLDGLLSLADSVTSVDLHLSKWTTITLCLSSLFVFITGSVMSLVASFRPRWPLLLASGVYTLYFGSKLAGAFTGVLRELGQAQQRVQNLEIAGVQLLLAAVCIIGLVRGRAATIQRAGVIPAKQAS